MITLTSKQLHDAAMLLGVSDDEETELALDVCLGHSGYGLYVWAVEYPEEGAHYLGPAVEN